MDHNAPVTIALAGNPNSGKTTIFNLLTGERQHTGNYPGVTVEMKEGTLTHEGRRIRVVDLPGTYSLSAYTPEERVARNVVIDERPDAVVNVVDASNLERNLYLTTQFMELGVPLVLVFNMSDLAESRGFAIDTAVLSRLLGVTIVTTVGHKGVGGAALRAAIAEVAGDPEAHRPRPVRYGEEIERELTAIIRAINAAGDLAHRFSPRWLALKLLEDDAEAVAALDRSAAGASVRKAARRARRRLRERLGDVAEVLVADHRYGFISGACQEAVKMTVEVRHCASDCIDRVVLHRVFGLPIFLAMMYVVFKVTFAVGELPMGWLEAGMGWLQGWVSGWWAPGTESALRSLLVDGVIGGVGGVVVFLPNILLLFLAISLLEDSGYMARAAFVTDHFMHRIGLHGKSFIPMLIGFGCTVPAILATRTLESRRDRLVTMLILPLMSCGARLPIYALLIPAFFPANWRAPILWMVYMIGVVVAILVAKLLRLTLFRGEIVPFVMELPLYRTPTLKGTLVHVLDPCWMFLRKAGTVVLALSIVLWALTRYPELPEARTAGLAEDEKRQQALAWSAAGRFGRALEPVGRLAGFDWKINTALIGAFAAKEVFVAQMGIVHSRGDTDETAAGQEGLRAVLRQRYTPLQAVSIILFCLIGTPCLATVAATWKESGSWRWAALQMGGLTLLAFTVCVAVYQLGLLLGMQ